MNTATGSAMSYCASLEETVREEMKNERDVGCVKGGQIP